VAVVQELGIGKDGRGFQDWAAWHANAPHSRAPTDDEKTYLLQNLSMVLDC
jgi:hypothetical protein